MNTNIWQGRLIRLRAVEPADWQHFAAMDEESETARLTYWIPFPKSSEAAKQWAAEQATTGDKNHEFRWVIETLDGQFAGTLNTHTCDARTGTFRYGLAIAGAQRSKGYASEAIRLVLRYFFLELRYQKVNVDVYAFNEPSLRLHRKLGFVEEGRLRRVIFTGGAYHDAVMLGMTREEFEESEHGGCC